MGTLFYIIYTILKTIIISAFALGVIYYLGESLRTWAHSNDGEEDIQRQRDRHRKDEHRHDY